VTRRKGAGVASIENDARLANVLAGDRDNQQVSRTSRKSQDQIAALIRQTGPRPARPGWVRFVATDERPDTALAAALRQALLERRGRR